MKESTPFSRETAMAIKPFVEKSYDDAFQVYDKSLRGNDPEEKQQAKTYVTYLMGELNKIDAIIYDCNIETVNIDQQTTIKFPILNPSGKIESIDSTGLIIASEQVFQPYSLSELQNMPPKEWLIDQLFGKKDIGMIYGPSGCGKTFVVIDLIMKACTGEPWAESFDIQRPLNVAYCAGEGIGGLPARFAAAAKHYDIDSPVNLSFYKTIPQLYVDGNNDSGIEASIHKFVHERKRLELTNSLEALDVLVLDTFHTATEGADENSARDTGTILRCCRWASNELGCAVILIHHTNKGATAERGSSALRGAMDFMIEVKKPLDTGTEACISCSKLKDGERWSNKTFTLVSQKESGSAYVSWNNNTDQIKTIGLKANDKLKLLAEMKRCPEKRFTCKTLTQVIDKAETYTRTLLNELADEHECLKELSDPTKSLSSRNSWVYYAPDVPQEIAASVA